MMREKERKRLIKIELDKQLREKEGRKKKVVEEDHMYEGLQKQHISLLEQREIEKNEEMRRKIRLEKESRDKQLQEEKYKKKRDHKEQFQ
jgi:sorbitol-specific phosphotransferase system component IIBC